MPGRTRSDDQSIAASSSSTRTLEELEIPSHHRETYPRLCCPAADSSTGGMSHMRAGRSWPLAAALGVVLAFAAPAAAHEYGLGSSWLTEDHPGWYWPSTSSKTDNFEMVGSVHRTRA